MHLHHFTRQQTLSIAPDVAWAFFSNPANLQTLSPDWAGMRDESHERPKTIYPGLIQVYRIKTLGPFSCRWVAEITHVDAPNSFVDEQKVGPFAFWHHRHQFVPNDKGVTIIDTVHYALPCLPFMNIVHELFIRERLEALFDFRAETLDEFFQ